MPLSFVSETDDELTCGSSKLHYRIFRPSQSRAGSIVGDFLLRQGHRDVIYFETPSQDSFDWSMRRFEGLQCVFADHGHSHSVYRSQTLPESGSNRMTQTGLDRFTRQADTVPSQCEKNCRQLQPIVDALHTLDTESFFDRRFIDKVRHECVLNLHEEEGVPAIIPLVKRALAHTSATAIVAANDAAAVALLRLCELYGVAIGERLSVIGFDDSTVAVEHHITSYNFDFPAIVHKAVQFLINPRHEFFKGRVVVECEGYVVERRTTVGV